MKKLFLILALSFHSLVSFAQSFELRPMAELVSQIEGSKFTFKEKGLLFGFSSIQSCMYVAEEMVIFKNYCSPRNNYPARGYTIISAKFGMIDIYEEQIGAINKRDITQTEFSQNLAPYLTIPLPLTSLDSLSAVMETLYSQYNPGCWSTNWSHYSHLPEAACSRAAGDVLGFDVWNQGTQEITGNDEAWAGLFQTIEKQLGF